VGPRATSRRSRKPKRPPKTRRSPPRRPKRDREGRRTEGERKRRGTAKAKPKPKYPPFAEVIKEATKIDGLITLYRKDDTLLAELGPEDLNHDMIVLISIARGIGQTPILGGYSWQFGDDWVGNSARRVSRFTGPPQCAVYGR